MRRHHPSRQRYATGQKVYVRGWPLADTAVVTDVLISEQGWPFYELLAADAPDSLFHCSSPIVKHYYLRRGRAWICAPAGHDQAAPFTAGLTVDTDPDAAWLTPSLDLAHERQALLRHVFGWATEIRACAANA